MLCFSHPNKEKTMIITKALALTMTAAGLLIFALPVQAQSNQHRGGNSYPGNTHHDGGWYHNGGYYHHHYYYGGSRVNFYFGGAFGYPFFGYPFGGYPYYGYGPWGYGYGYPTGAYYTYDPRGIYQGRVVSGAGAGSHSVAVQVQQQLAAAGYYHGEIDGIIGAGTRRAIRNYERDNNLPVDGRIDDQLLASMGR
jgi:hypothetical protein